MPHIRGWDGAAMPAPLLISRYRVVAQAPDGERCTEVSSSAAAQALLHQWMTQGIPARLEVIGVSPRAFACEPGVVAHHLPREGLWVYALPEDLARCLVQAERCDWDPALDQIAQWLQTCPARVASLRDLGDEEIDLAELRELQPVLVVASIEEADHVVRPSQPLLGVIARVPLHIPAIWPEARDH